MAGATLVMVYFAANPRLLVTPRAKWREVSGRVLRNAPLVNRRLKLTAQSDTLSTNQGEAVRMAIRLTRNLGMLLLAIWLILTGLMPLLNLSFSGAGTLMAILAIAAGVLLLIGR